MSVEKIEILNRVARGELSVDEGNRLLAELDGAEPAQPEVWMPAGAANEANVTYQPGLNDDEMKRVKAWRRWNWIPLFLFLVLTGFAGTWIYKAYVSTGLGWRFWLSWLPFLIGVLGVYAFWNMKWVHVRVREKKGDHVSRVSVSIPLPIGLLPWVFNTFGRYMPANVKGQQESILMINEALKSDDPIHVHVNENEDEEVEVFIG